MNCSPSQSVPLAHSYRSQNLSYKESGPIDVINMYENNELLVKMLTHSYPGYFERLDEELDELRYVGEIRSSSTSSLLQHKPFALYRDYGFILHPDRCTVKSCFSRDVGTRRVDTNGREVTWCCSEKCYVACQDKTEKVDYQGAFDCAEYEGLYRVASLKDLATTDVHWKLHNEVIVDYDSDSIIGLIFTKQDGFHMKTKPDAIKKIRDQFINICFVNFGFKVPLFEYNPENGHLIEISDQENT